MFYLVLHASGDDDDDDGSHCHGGNHFEYSEYHVFRA